MTRIGRLLVAGGVGVLWTAGPLARPGGADADLGSIVVSDEVYSTSTDCSNTVELREAADRLDQSWRALVGADRYVVGEIGLDTESDPALDPSSEPDPDPTPITFADLDLPVVVSGHDVSPDEADSTDPESWGRIDPAATGDPDLARSDTLQDCAPLPSRADAAEVDERPVQWQVTDGEGELLDAVVFDFAAPVSAFGAWFGDVESRTDGEGRPAVVKLFDEDGVVVAIETLAPDRPVPLGDDPSGRTSCGGDDDSDALACGNQATRFIGFVTAEPVVARMMVIVGDDDACADGADCDGASEHLSFVAPQVAVFDLPPATPVTTVPPTTVPPTTVPQTTVPQTTVPSTTVEPGATSAPPSTTPISTVQGSTIPISPVGSSTAPTTVPDHGAPDHGGSDHGGSDDRAPRPSCLRHRCPRPRCPDHGGTDHGASGDRFLDTGAFDHLECAAAGAAGPERHDTDGRGAVPAGIGPHPDRRPRSCPGRPRQRRRRGGCRSHRDRGRPGLDGRRRTERRRGARRVAADGFVLGLVVGARTRPGLVGDGPAVGVATHTSGVRTTAPDDRWPRSSSRRVGLWWPVR